MINQIAVKKMFWVAMDAFLILFVLPFGFVMSYYFNLFFTGKNQPNLLADLAELSGTVSWVSCAFLFLIAIILRTMIRRRKRWHSLFALSFIGGGLWLILWNIFIESTFTFWRSLFPLTLCCVVSTVYALGKVLYNDDSWNFANEPQLDYHEKQEVLNEGQETGGSDQESGGRGQ